MSLQPRQQILLYNIIEQIWLTMYPHDIVVKHQKIYSAISFDRCDHLCFQLAWRKILYNAFQKPFS